MTATTPPDEKPSHEQFACAAGSGRSVPVLVGRAQRLRLAGVVARATARCSLEHRMPRDPICYQLATCKCYRADLPLSQSHGVQVQKKRCGAGCCGGRAGRDPEQCQALIPLCAWPQVRRAGAHVRRYELIADETSVRTGRHLGRKHRHACTCASRK